MFWLLNHRKWSFDSLKPIVIIQQVVHLMFDLRVRGNHDNGKLLRRVKSCLMRDKATRELIYYNTVIVGVDEFDFDSNFSHGYDG